jgi:hypothetical protein
MPYLKIKAPGKPEPLFLVELNLLLLLLAAGLSAHSCDSRAFSFGHRCKSAIFDCHKTLLLLFDVGTAYSKQ